MPSERSSFWSLFAVLGPGLAVAATGIGAGDIVAAAVSGARYGTVVLWAAVVGALLKFSLNEGIARWQLATGTTLLEGWAKHLHRLFSYAFGVYLGVWSFVVAGALMAACGLAAHALVPGVSVALWGAVHALVALGLVYFGRYQLFERLMKVFIALMFGTVLVCAVLVRPDWGSLAAQAVVPVVPAGAGPFLLGVIGGVGGSVTLLSYGYWIREKGWAGPEARRAVRLDLGVAYLLTGLFGGAVILISAGVAPAVMEGGGMAIEVGRRVEAVAGPAARWTFLIGFWGAVFTSMLGVWQGVPYLFADLVRVLRPAGRGAAVETTSAAYRGYLLYLAVPPMLLLLVDRPVWIVLVYTVAGAFFMPVLAGTLLYLNNRSAWVRGLRNGWAANAALIIALIVFAYLCTREL